MALMTHKICASPISFGQQVNLDDVNITYASSADIITGEQFGIL